MFSCLQILDVFLWFVLITLLNFTLIILTLSVSRLLNLLLRLVAFLLFPLHDALPIYPEGLPRLGREDVAAAPAPRAARACRAAASARPLRSEEHTSELQSLAYLVCRLLLEKKNIEALKPAIEACGISTLF